MNLGGHSNCKSPHHRRSKTSQGNQCACMSPQIDGERSGLSLRLQESRDRSQGSLRLQEPRAVVAPAREPPGRSTGSLRLQEPADRWKRTGLSLHLQESPPIDRRGRCDCKSPLIDGNELGCHCACKKAPPNVHWGHCACESPMNDGNELGCRCACKRAHSEVPVAVRLQGYERHGLHPQEP